MVALSVLVWCLGVAPCSELNNGEICIRLGSFEGIPSIREIRWTQSDDRILSREKSAQTLSAWVPESLVPEDFEQTTTAQDQASVAWQRTDDDVFLRAEARRSLALDTEATWIAELARKGSIIRLHVRLTNRGNGAAPIEWFPAWTASWNVPGAKVLRGWRSLTFAGLEQPLDGKTITIWGSRLHSSDTPNDGMNPYWVVAGGKNRLFFGLEWCGGWQARLWGEKGVFGFDVRLPADETQLLLRPGEAIDGPILHFTPIGQEDEALARAAWMAQRAALAQTLYPGPAPSYPFTYNNWYTTRFDLDLPFLKRQAANMAPYKFDAFIVDAGWYEGMGQWTPSKAKFAPGQFENLLNSIKAAGVRTGIWTCPQFVAASPSHLPSEVDSPPTFEKFINGYLLDLSGCGYENRLTSHVAMLREKYGVEWWKYDQLLFSEKSRAGVMRNVIAFQDALRAVRKAQPDLTIENCQSGGRMINELTVLSTQSQWLRDGGNTGMPHARTNVSDVLGSLEFVFPWTANRWTNNPDRIESVNDEITRYYCRSAMPGTWGLVADLARISDHQRDVILKEVQRYRRLNTFKKDCLYDLYLPLEGAPAAGVVFYTADGHGAAILLFRWDKTGPFDFPVRLRFLRDTGTYRIEDADAALISRHSGPRIGKNGLTVGFGPTRHSALVFIEAVQE